MSTPTTTGLTYDDLVTLQERPEYEFQRLELIDGELHVSPAPVPFHQLISNNFSIALGPCIVRQQLGQIFAAPIDVRLSRHDVVEPDIVFIRRERLHIIGPTVIDGAPDLVIEILSKSTRRRDLTLKKALYERYGVPEYWIVDPDARAVIMFALVDGKYESIPIVDGIIRSTVLPGCVITLTELFGLQSYQQ